MQSPTLPQPHNFGIPYWALTSNLTEHISVVVGGCGNPVDFHDLDEKDEYKFLDERQKKILLFIHGARSLEGFRKKALEEEDTEVVSVGLMGIDALREFARIYGVPEKTVSFQFGETSGVWKISLSGTLKHTPEEAEEVLRPYHAALAQYQKDLAAYEAYRAQKIQNFRDKFGVQS